MSKLNKGLINTLLAATLLLPGAMHAADINVDFGNQNAVPSASFGASASQPGVWNNIDSLGTTNNLLNLSGTPTGISVDLVAGSIGGGAGSTASDNITLLRNDNFFSGSPALWSVTFSGLDDGTYSLYYYAPMNTAVPTGPFTANGVSEASLSGNGDTTPSLIQGEDWQVVTGISVTTGVLQLINTLDSSDAGLAGLQLVETSAAPEPSTILLLACSLIPLAARSASRTARIRS